MSDFVPKDGSDDVSRQWHEAFSAAAKLVCKIIENLSFDKLEARYAKGDGSITEAMKSILESISDEASAAVRSNTMQQLDVLRKLDVTALQQKTVHLGYTPFTFILSVLINHKQPDFTSEIQKREYAFHAIAVVVDHELGLGLRLN